jgi:hypothetical protein
LRARYRAKKDGLLQMWHTPQTGGDTPELQQIQQTRAGQGGGFCLEAL